MKSKRTDRLASQFVREISEIILRKLGDPRLHWVTITRTEISPDLREAKVYIQTLETGEKREQMVSALKHAEGFIRHELGHRLSLRVIPAIRFLIDEGMEKAEHVLRMIDQLEAERGPDDGRTDTGS